MKRSILLLVLAICVAIPVTADLPESRHEQIFHVIAADRPPPRLVGRGIPSLGEPSTDQEGNEIVWREIRREVDPRGGTHVFYQQYLVGADVEAAIHRTEVGVHYRPSGALEVIGGSQAESVRVSNRPRLRAAAMPDRAASLLRVHRGDAAPMAALSEELRAFREKQTTLRLVQMDDGDYRFVYFTHADDVDGRYPEIVVDAENGRLLAMQDQGAHGNCTPTSPLQSVTAKGYPVRSGAAQRVLKANVAPDRAGGFTHEGFYAYSSPNQSVYQETNNSHYFCTTGSSRSYTLFPLKTDASGTPVYRDDDPEFQGKIAGDALYHTFQTMRALSSMGRRGWDGRNGEAKIVIQSSVNGTSADGGQFIQTPNTPTAPSNSVALGPAGLMFPMAASLDLVAHEWGHGVIFKSANFDRGTAVGRELHEGYSDVIANIVEKKRQPAGYGLEQSSDWYMHEDAGVEDYARGPEDDHDGHGWRGPNGVWPIVINDSVHREDAGNSTHARGNRIMMAFRLLAEGGENPICLRPGATFAGCGTSVPAMGVSKASRIMFDALVYYAPSTTTWETLPQWVNQSAYANYNLCVYDPCWNGRAEQDAVNAAFTAIGYPRLTGEVMCGGVTPEMCP